ncbi:MAG: glycosyltransferase family 4 protein [bacterium]
MSKKVAFCVSGYNIFYGAQQSLYNFLLNVNKDDIESIFIAPGEGVFTEKIDSINISKKIIEYPKELDKSGDEIRQNSLLNKLKLGFGSLKFIKKYFDYFSKSNFDLVYCNDIRTILTAGIAARLKRIPVVWYVRIDKDLGVFNWFAANIATKIVTIADNVQNIFPKKLIYNSKEKFKTIYTGLDLQEIDSIKPDDSLRKELDLAEDTKLAAVIASIQPRKGQKDLVKSLIKIKDEIRAKNIKFIIVGDILNDKYKSYLEDMKDLISKNNMKENIIFLGWRDDVYNILKQIDFMILPSYSEGLPRTVLEAFACQCPVIATNVGGTKEIIDTMENGLIIEPGCISGLSNAILNFLRDDENLKKMGFKARKKVEENFVIQKYISDLQAEIIKLSK